MQTLPLKKVNPPQIKNNILISWYYPSLCYAHIECCFNRVSKKKGGNRILRVILGHNSSGSLCNYATFFGSRICTKFLFHPTSDSTGRRHAVNMHFHQLQHSYPQLLWINENVSDYIFYIFLCRIINFSYWTNKFPHSMRSSVSYNILAIIT